MSCLIRSLGGEPALRSVPCSFGSQRRLMAWSCCLGVRRLNLAGLSSGASYVSIMCQFKQLLRSLNKLLSRGIHSMLSPVTRSAHLVPSLRPRTVRSTSPTNFPLQRLLFHPHPRLFVGHLIQRIMIDHPVRRTVGICVSRAGLAHHVVNEHSDAHHLLPSTPGPAHSSRPPNVLRTWTRTGWLPPGDL